MSIFSSLVCWFAGHLWERDDGISGSTGDGHWRPGRYCLRCPATGLEPPFAPDSDVGMLRNKIELLEEDLECPHMWLDDMGVPRGDDGGEFSIVGRVKRLLASTEEDPTPLPPNQCGR